MNPKAAPAELFFFDDKLMNLQRLDSLPCYNELIQQQQQERSRPYVSMGPKRPKPCYARGVNNPGGDDMTLAPDRVITSRLVVVLVAGDGNNVKAWLRGVYARGMTNGAGTSWA
jgi:hypothetical protein